MNRKISVTEAKRSSVKKVDLLPVKNDYVFSRLFGAKSHKRVLTCLLNAILNGKPHINDITLDPTDYKKKTPDGKSIRLDIAATSDDGTILNVEIQCIDEGNIADRSAFYQSVLREKYLKEGQDYSDVPNIISIWIAVDPVTQRKGCCHEIVDMYKDNGIDPIEIASEKMRQFIIELTKLEATPKRFLNDMFSIWMMFIKDPESIPPEFLEISEVKEAMEELTIMSMDKQTRAEYEARVKEMNSIYATERAGFKKGEKIGIEKGEKIGIEKGKTEGANEKAIAVAKAMLRHGDDIDYISLVSGLTIEEIKKIG